MTLSLQPNFLFSMIKMIILFFCRRCLEKTFDYVQLFDVMDSADSANLAMLQRPELGVTLTKLHCWTLTDFDKAVFLDADTLVLRNCDELFDHYDEFSAAPDIGWPDCFNSGVFVFRPSIRTYKSLLHFASTHGSFDGSSNPDFHSSRTYIICINSLSF